MNKMIKKVLLFSLIVLGLSCNSAMFANSTPLQNQQYKVAVVDVPMVLAKSSQVQALNLERQAKIKELEAWFVTAKADVDKQQTKEGKEKLLQKYNNEFAKKQETLRKDFAIKLQAIDKNISNAITNYAKANNYNMVLSKKTTVLYGGDDITEAIIKAIK